ncbi:MAG: tetratricopeptide repeat protein [Polyangiales bacterium]
MGEAVELLRKAHALAPNDGLVMSALGAALMRSSLMASGEDARVEAEDWALRALASDPSIAETYTTLGLVRLHQGNLKASLKAFREALARNPRSAEANSYVGRFLAEAGNTTEGVRRMELALRVDPAMQRAWWDLARTYALMGEHAKADAALDRGEAAGGSPDTSFMARGRITLWRGDVEGARALVARMESLAVDGSAGRKALLPALRSMVENGGVPDPSADVSHVFAAVVRSPSNRTFVWQVSTEVRAAGGDVDGALDALEKAASLALMDLLWLDRCPVLAPLRESPRYGKVRAAVAARTAELLGA